MKHLDRRSAGRDQLKSVSGPNPAMLRLILGAGLLCITGAEVTVYWLLMQYANAGEIPIFVPDVLIVTISTLEFLVAPLISWVGYSRPKGVLMLWLAVVIVCSLPMLFMTVPIQDTEEGADLCSSGTPSDVPKPSFRPVVTMTATAALGVACALARLGIWSHGLAHLLRHDPSKVGLSLSMLALCRVMGLLFLHYVAKLIIQTSMWFLTLLTVAPLALLLVLLTFSQERVNEDNPTSQEGRGLLISLKRVVTNPMAVSQMLGIGLIAAAAWGFALFNQDFVKVKYHAVSAPTIGTISGYALHFVLFAFSGITIYNLLFSAPLKPQFNELSALKMAALKNFAAGAVYLTLTFLGCETAPLSGLTDSQYVHPACSLRCGCTPPWNRFDPVCDVTEMTTFLSPCHAGCSVNETINEFRVFSGCSCVGATSRVISGACEVPSCVQTLDMHQLLFLVVNTIVVLAIQSQGQVLLRAVDPRDKAVTFGLASAVVSLFAFVGGHALYYTLISENNCIWHEGGRCLLQNTSFPLALSATSATFSLLAMIISMVTFFVLRRKKAVPEPSVEVTANDQELN